jgi:hypothetical protein
VFLALLTAFRTIPTYQREPKKGEKYRHVPGEKLIAKSPRNKVLPSSDGKRWAVD